MNSAGFVLTGGRSTRMGTDKALLPWRGRTLIEHVAGVVRASAGSVTLIGPPERYSPLGLPVTADAVPGRGPLGGILTALDVTPAEWNLVVACDMPGLTASFLESLLVAAEECGAGCLVPVSPSGRSHPLCAVYRRTLLPAVRQAVGEDRLKMTEVIAGLGTVYHAVSDEGLFLNMNTPKDFLTHREAVPPALAWTGRTDG